ncbi:restriction endonuclease subunit S [Thermococcus aciditolerans]|uniref:Restriction endonuclease subunit S n=1 Tax=Thermococcus aciditolerans TaxID=2598455 RepID=A0A5C0SIT4_9EURY|nr:restriction endonuclease subunit S [Thermococcus aciditolerans]QEK13912.1 restriction endonuclease subunit S [Thermococcus aciditolerans]
MQVKAKFKKTPIGEIPEDWKVVRLEEVVHFESGKRPKGGGQETGEVPSIGGEHIGSDGRIKWENMKFIPKEFFTQLRKGKVKVGDILLVKDGATTGKVAFVEDIKGYSEVAINEHVYLLRPKDSNTLHNLFLFYFMYSPFAQVQIQQAFHGMIGGIKNSELKRLLLFLPPLPEQKKIAEILRTVDEAIEKTDEAIERTERLKRGLMQRLLTRGINHERFKKTELGEIPEEWRVVRVGEICQSIVPGRNKPKKFDGDIPWITLADIDGMYIGASKSGLNVSKEEIKRCGNKIIPPNSVIMSCVGKFGIVAITTREVVLNQQLHAFVCPKTLDPYFLAVALMSQARYMESIATKTTVPYLNKDKINSIPIPIPPLEEQKRIAEILMTVDRKLELLRKRREKLEKVKKGLMRDLLTGRKRVLVTTEKHK